MKHRIILLTLWAFFNLGTGQEIGPFVNRGDCRMIQREMNDSATKPGIMFSQCVEVSDK